MSDVKFQRTDPGFKQLVAKTQQAIRNDQQISGEELAELKSIAEEDDLLSLAESNFLLAAQDSRNHQTILTLGSAQSEFSLFIDEICSLFRRFAYGALCQFD